MKKIILIISFIMLSGCSALAGIAAEEVLDTGKDGIELTAQVGKTNNKGMVTTSIDTSKDLDLDFDEVKGNANVDSGNTVNNDAKTMIGLVLAGMFFPMLLLFYIMPAPRWVAKQHAQNA